MTDPGVEEVTHRGVRWQRAPNGAMRWRDDDADGWVRYRAGQDAPPRPPGWEPRRRGLVPSGVTLDRPAWRSPYRIAPIVLVLAVIGFGIAQAAGGSGGQGSDEAKAADGLVGKCLVPAGFSDGHPTYSPKGVACNAVGALVKVTKVLPGTPGSPQCPQGTTAVVLAFPGVAYPHQLCTVVNGA